MPDPEQGSAETKHALRRPTEPGWKHPVLSGYLRPGKACFSVKSVYFGLMEATLTELRRDMSRVLDPLRRGEKVTLTEHGQKVAEIVPTKIDRQAAFEALRAIGPVQL